jgi:hypothetical protein
MGTILEKTGAALSMTQVILKLSVSPVLRLP